MRSLFTVTVTVTIGVIAASAQTMGLVQYDAVYSEGYVLFAPIASTHTYLVDRCGRRVNEWTSVNTPGLSAQLRPDGTLLRAANTLNPIYDGGGRGGRIERYDWSGNLLWSYDLSNDTLCQHHDFTVLPNGNILVIAWDRRDSLEAVAQGKKPADTHAELWSDQLLELQPVGTNMASIVWHWKLWDHLVQDFNASLPGYGIIADHPELVNINFFQGLSTNPDWIHLNSVSYNPQLDQVMVSSHALDEIWIIDHSTTTAEAASHSGGGSGRGGDLLYRWGNPRAYDRGVFADQRLFGQHHATWLPEGHADAGKILVFNNGTGRPGEDYSSLDIIDPSGYAIEVGEPFAPEAAEWSWSAPTPTDFYSANISGVFPVADGFLATDGPEGRFFQINASENVAWQYINPVNGVGPMAQGDPPFGNSVFRCVYYAPDFPGFAGQSLVPGTEIETDPQLPSLCTTSDVNEALPVEPMLYPNPTIGVLWIKAPSMELEQMRVLDLTGRTMPAEIRTTDVGAVVDLRELAPGAYMVVVHSGPGGMEFRVKVVREGM